MPLSKPWLQSTSSPTDSTTSSPASVIPPGIASVPPGLKPRRNRRYMSRTQPWLKAVYEPTSDGDLRELLISAGLRPPTCRGGTGS